MWILRLTGLVLVLTAEINSGVGGGQLKVTFPINPICALSRSTVVIRCSYDYPNSQTKPGNHNVTPKVWYGPGSDKKHLASLSSIPAYQKRFSYPSDNQHDCTLTLTNLRVQDEGSYTFKFEGGITRLLLNLSVTDLTAEVHPATVKEGQKVILTCNTSCEVTDNPAFVWFKDDKEIFKTEFQVTLEDAGNYRCGIKKQIKSAPVLLDVQYAPKDVILSISPTGDVVEGSNVTFSCSSYANPVVVQNNYTLHKDKNENPLAKDNRFIISYAEPHHTGYYYCQSSNGIQRNGTEFFMSDKVHLNVKSRRVNPLYATAGVVGLVALMVAIMVFMVLVCYWRKKKIPTVNQAEAFSGPSWRELKPLANDENSLYANLPSSFSRPHLLCQDTPLYSDVQFPSDQRGTAQLRQNLREEDVVYSAVKVQTSRSKSPNPARPDMHHQHAWLRRPGENIIYSHLAKK